VTSTSTSNRAQGKYCVGCRTRQKKKNPDSKKSQRDPPPHLLSLCAFGGARRARRCYLSRKRVRICLPAGWQKASGAPWRTVHPRLPQPDVWSACYSEARNILGGWANCRRLYELRIHARIVVKFSWFG
jgi:hypothetical protein